MIETGNKRKNILLLVSTLIVILSLVITLTPLFVLGQEADPTWAISAGDEQEAPAAQMESQSPIAPPAKTVPKASPVLETHEETDAEVSEKLEVSEELEEEAPDESQEQQPSTPASPEPVIPTVSEAPEATPAPAASPVAVVAANRAPAANEALRTLQVKVQVTNQGTASSSNIRLEIPMLARIDSPYQSLLDERFSHQPTELSSREMAGRAMHLEISSLAPGNSETITLEYTLAASQTAGAQPGAGAISQYLAPSPKVESGNAEIAAAAKRAIQNSQDNYEKARDIYSYVVGHMSYSASASSHNQGALSALKNGKGVCEDYASLFVALSRAAGIPARVVNGYADPRGTGDVWNLSPGKTLPMAGYRHAWAEFYVEGKGWLPADPTFESAPNSFKYFATIPIGGYIAQNYLDQNIRARFQGGQLSVTWEESLVN